jgi:outer membrane immunogenic protein
MPVKAAPMAPPPVAYNWTGFYIGVNIGGAWGSSSTNSPITCPAGGTRCYLASVLADINAQAAQNVSSSGVTGGLQLGYNVQMNSFVYGVEADFNAMNLRGSQTTSAYFTAFPGPGTAPTYTNSISTNWLFTARGRLGFLVSNNVLVYGTGGLAVTDLKYTHTFVEGVFSGSSSGTESSTASATKAGYAIGGGLEYALMNHWSVKAEYLYLNFGNVNTTGAVAFPANPVSSNVFANSANLHANIARLGVNYKF